MKNSSGFPIDEGKGSGSVSAGTFPVSAFSVSGFRSIRALEGFRLRNLNVLIGANGAGKSNFMALFRFLNQMVGQRRLQVFAQQAGGPDALLHFGRETSERLRGELAFGPDRYAFDLMPTRDNRLIFDREAIRFGGPSADNSIEFGSGHAESRIEEAGDRHAARIRASIGDWRVWHFHDTGETAKVSRIHPSNDTLRLKTDAANLAAYLGMLRREHEATYRKIVATIGLVAPFFEGFIQRPGAPESVQLEWTHRGNPDTPFKAHVLSDGTLRFMCLATLLLQPVALLPATILIDEPELGLHPYAISVLAGMLQQVAENRQLIIATQSVALINELELEDIIVVDQEEGASTFRRLDREELGGWLEEYALGELWERNILGGNP